MQSFYTFLALDLARERAAEADDQDREHDDGQHDRSSLGDVTCFLCLIGY